MADVYHQEKRGMQKYNHRREPRAHQVVKAATAATAGGSLLVLSSLMLTGTVIALTVATPLLVIFSPVLVPAVITLFLLATGFLTSGGLGVAAVTVLRWMYKYMRGGPTHKLGSKAGELGTTESMPPYGTGRANNTTWSI